MSLGSGGVSVLAHALGNGLYGVDVRSDELRHNGIYTLRNAETGYYLNVDDFLQYDGAKVIQSTHDYSYLSSNFRFESVGQDIWTMMGLFSDRQMMLDSSVTGSAVVKARDSEKLDNQAYKLVPNDDGTYAILSKSSNYTQYLQSTSMTDGASIIFGVGTTYASWTITKGYYSGGQDSINSLENGGVVRIKNVRTGKYLDMKSFGLNRGEWRDVDSDSDSYALLDNDYNIDENNNNIGDKAFDNNTNTVAQIYDGHGGLNQKFRLNYLGNNDWEIIPMQASGNRALTVVGNANQDNIGINQQGNLNNWGQNTSNTAQRFRFTKISQSGDRTYTISTGSSNYTRYLGVQNNGTANSTPVVQSSAYSSEEWAIYGDVDDSAVYYITSNSSTMASKSISQGGNIIGVSRDISIYPTIVGASIGATYYDNDGTHSIMPNPQLDEGATMGQILDHTDTIVQEGGRDKYLIRSWRHYRVLNAPVYNFNNPRELVPGETGTVGVEQSETNTSFGLLM